MNRLQLPRKRLLLLGSAAVVVLVLVVVLVVSQSGGPAPATGQPAAAPPAATDSTGSSTTALDNAGVTASWVVAENRKPGTTAWRIADAPASGTIAGFANQVYARDGQQVSLYVSSSAPSFHVEAYRVGYYGGTGARLVWQSAETPGRLQPPCPVIPVTNMVACDNWQPAISFPVGADWPQGDYLLKLVGAHHEQSFVPLTVWDPASKATYVIKNDVFTWQAWNTYGGYDYYVGQGPCPPKVYPLCSRARVVSYDRPYGDEQGTGDFLWLEAPLIRFVEQHGLDVAYATDLTLVQHPDFLAGHKALFSLGHDECWSLAERQDALAAYQHGLNLAFFGASGVLRHVRTQPSPLGPDREVVDYRDSSADPLNGKGDPRQVTGNTWGSPPASWPETQFVGESYNGFLEPNVRANLTVVDANSWIFAGTGLTNGATLQNVIGSDVDSLEPPLGHPDNVQVLAHSALPAAKAQTNTHQGPVFYSDMTYYTNPTSQAGVWDSGTNNWIPALEPGSGEPPAAAEVVDHITANLLHLLGQGPAGTVQPAPATNYAQLYPTP